MNSPNRRPKPPESPRPNPPERARLLRIPLDGELPAPAGALLVRGEAHPFALTGAWAGGGALVGSEPLAVAPEDADPFSLLDLQPAVDASGDDAADAVGGGWFGFLGYGLGARLEALPPGPPRPVPLPRFALAFYDHLLRLDTAGRWWFEALWTPERERILEGRVGMLAARLAEGVEERAVQVGALSPSPPGAAGHLAAVASCRERIAAGEIFQANVCLRLEGSCAGDPVDLFARGARELAPRHAALVAGPWGALCSMSPELFLRRRGREVVTEPIKGTAPRQGLAAGARDALAASAKDRAENVMIVDLMRNDLGRVCEYGSVAVNELAEPRPAPGVWHLVSTVSATLRPEVGDADLLRASFPPGSVTGAPKIQTMRVIAELEATGREAYTGAIGFASPLAGLELSVAIRTMELRDGRVWLGAGGGIVADSDPEAELEECLVKARPVVEAVGGRLVRPATAFRRAEPTVRATRFYGDEQVTNRATAVDRAEPVVALDGEISRPDPECGVLSTLLVRDGEAVDAGDHLARLGDSVRELYGRELSLDLGERVRAVAAAQRRARLRVIATPTTGGELALEVESDPLPQRVPAEPVALAPVALPGGLGRHKWRDRRLLARLERRLGAVALLVDLDRHVLEAAHANVWIVEGDRLVTPPLDGRLLPGVVRARLLADPPAGLEPREEPVTLDRLIAADDVLLSSSIRGLHPAALAGRAAHAREPLPS